MSTNAAVHYSYAVGAALITAVKEVVVLTGETPSANSVEVDEGVAPFWHLRR
jgi:hypothetical protein